MKELTEILIFSVLVFFVMQVFTTVFAWLIMFFIKMKVTNPVRFERVRFWLEVIKNISMYLFLGIILWVVWKYAK